ncbi:hypothetical protein Acr_14g0009870 [Actinidia rufa]|uniref:Phosphoglycerate mutase family protein n=1 Tax=Actinidia rufa TaxID=165716 RepID=A0A7J0FRL2_9ERIC|nr:hypothetical protein Acr_14g0009870 [Actinidia rufa]
MPSCLVSAPLSPTSSPLVFHQKGYNFLSSIKCCEDTVGTARVKYENNGSATFPEKNLVLDRSTIRLPWPPPRPRRIILLRPEACGRRIREMIKKDQADDWKVYFYVSPYRRTLETLRNVAKAFGRSRIAGVREEARLREQDFDVYDRITGFRETLRADIDIGRFQPPGEQSPNMNLVIVSHGLTLRVFLMRWYKWTVEQFQGLNNMGNGNIVVMERGAGGRQKVAKPGEVNYHCPMTGPSFFTHFGDDPRRE